MLSLMGFATVGVILALLLAHRTAAVVALAGVPVVAGLLAGFSPAEIGAFATDGIGGVAGVTAMFVFAIVYFGLMKDVGLFDPVIRRIVAFAGGAPVTVCVATTALAAAAHLDGAGATTFLITIPAMLPLFDRLGMRRLVLTTCVGLGAGVMNLMPWGGPTARASATSGVDANELWVPLLPAQAAGLVAALLVAWWLGRREARRLAGA
ncbi:SLC13 family permease, partial [Saccharomonospora saliphila]|uniref:SLC13 family permease n=1 Tax=Saccharomonospora saliphila TaxID=369829 RepID=UPI000374C794